MGEQVKELKNTLIQRWMNKMPTFFRNIFWLCSLISGMALATNTAMTAAGAVPPEWWSDIFPYLVGIPAGMAFAAKFSQTYGTDGKPVSYEDYKEASTEGRTILDKDNN
jgi:hypothetical protein